LESVRRSFPKTYAYSSDIRCYDRAQDHSALRAELAFYKRMGLTQETLDKWSETHGIKRARSMMFGVIFCMVLGGVSGLWKTLLRNGLINIMSVIMAAALRHRDIVMLEVKGDDMDMELSREIDVDDASTNMSSMFNLSAKFFSATIRYMCKEFRFMVNGRWYYVADPWARVQSLCTPLWIGNKQDNLEERWVSLVADLRHYDNGILVDKVAELAQVYYAKPNCFFGMARGLAAVRADKLKYFKFFGKPELVM